MNLFEIARLEMPDDRPEILKALTAQAPTTELYNRFLFEVARQYKPPLMLETGTDRGRSAAHLALGNPTGMVVTIDIDPACKANVDALGIRNIVSRVGDSLGLAHEFSSLDLLFLDSLHTYEHTKAEWEAYRPRVKPGGLIFLDDIALDASMKRFWTELRFAKFDLTHLHYSGFGAIVNL